ncbi:MAG: ABC transporter ATP-binding protein [Actinomycetaceae bacterium]|nr:ABC transporter ATP-binding protein [Actinomycetaceae bacterium]
MPPVSKAPSVVKTKSGERAIRVSFILSLLTAFFVAVIFVAMGRMVNEVSVITAQNTSSQSVRSLFVLVIVAIILAAVAEFFRIYYGHSAAAHQEALLRHRLVERLFHLGPAITDKEETGSLVSTCTDGVERVATYRQTYLGTLWAGFAIPILSLTFMALFVDWLTALILLCLFPAVPLLLVLFKYVMKKFTPGQRHARNKLAAAYLEAIQGLETLTLLGATKRMGVELRETGEANRLAIMRMLAGNQLILFVVDSGFNLCLITTATLSCAFQAGSGMLSAGQVVSIIGLTVLLLEPMDQIAGFFYVGMGGMANQRKIGRIFGESPSMIHGVKGFLSSIRGRRAGSARGEAGHGSGTSSDAKVQQHGHPRAHGHSGTRGNARAHGHPGASSTLDIGELEERTYAKRLRSPLHRIDAPLVVIDTPLCSGSGIVSVRGLNYSYGGSHQVLHDIDLDVSAGEHSAIVGPSGEGKSTLVKLLKGVLVAKEGSISVNGCDCRNGDQAHALREASAFVAQSTWLFNATVRMNLQIANSEASDDQLWQALEQANIAEDIASMPQGLDTWVGDRGFGMSGGQMQRLSLARAFVSNKSIIILDEPTSQVDLISEERIIEAIARISQQKTVLMITHRRSSLRGFDCIYDLAQGRLYHSRTTTTTTTKAPPASTPSQPGLYTPPQPGSRPPHASSVQHSPILPPIDSAASPAAQAIRNNSVCDEGVQR